MDAFAFAMKNFKNGWNHALSKSGIAVHEGTKEDWPIRERALVRQICLTTLRCSSKAGTIEHFCFCNLRSSGSNVQVKLLKVQHVSFQAG